MVTVNTPSNTPDFSQMKAYALPVLIQFNLLFVFKFPLNNLLLV